MKIALDYQQNAGPASREIAPVPRRRGSCLDRYRIASAGAPEVAVEEAQNNPHAAQLRQGYRVLGFTPALEEAFRQYYWSMYRRHTRIGMFCGAVLFSAFAWRDVQVLPQEVWQVTVAIRMYLMVPALLICVPLTYFERAPLHFPLMIWGGIFCVLGGLASVLIYAEYAGSSLPYEGLMLVILFCYLLSGVRLYRAAFACITVTVAYIVANHLLGLTAVWLTPRVYYLVAANVMGIVGGYSSEYLLRRIFLIEGLANFRASRDPLTLLPNRRAAMEHLGRAWKLAAREKMPMGLMLLDVDHFKSYNDRYGHTAGDRALADISKALSGVLHRPMDLVARYGGEEFIAIAYGLDTKKLMVLADDMRLAVSKLDLAHSGNPREGKITISIGAVGLSPRDAGAPALAMIDSADRALYRAKEGGRNRTVLASD